MMKKITTLPHRLMLWGMALLPLVLVSCQPSVLQTVETGEQFLPDQDPKYRFVRNQESSVDLQEPELILSLVRELGERYLAEAYIRTNDQLAEAFALIDEGQYGYAPADYVATSQLHTTSRQRIGQDIKDWIRLSAEISGLGAESPNQHRRREAQPGRSGYIATSASARLTFADARGLVVAESFATALLGAIALDNVLGVHLDEAVYTSESLISEHEHQSLFRGTNYTALEHHWDLAYGYYLHALRPLAVGNGVIALRGVARQLDLAFTLGRIDIGYHLYDKLGDHVRTIRRELARVVLIRLETLLLGGNTLANLREDARFAFAMLSEAYGLIYALQFLRQSDGAPYFSYEEVKALQAQLLGEQGFWQTERLLGSTAGQGALYDIVQAVRERLRPAL